MPPVTFVVTTKGMLAPSATSATDPKPLRLLVTKVERSDPRLAELHCRVLDADGVPLAFWGVPAGSYTSLGGPTFQRSELLKALDFVFLLDGKNITGGRVIITTAEREWAFECK